jgi:arylsulfatase A
MSQKNLPLKKPKQLLPLYLLALLTLLCSILSPAQAASHPNILLILADDLGYGDLGCYNPESKIPTPHLDKLASQGMRFTDAHSPATVCTPTRYSLMTGGLCFRTGKSPVFSGVGGPCLIQDAQLTLAEMLKEAGYATAMTGKWHIGLTFFDKEGKPIRDNGLDACSDTKSPQSFILLSIDTNIRFKCSHTLEIIFIALFDF